MHFDDESDRDDVEPDVMNSVDVITNRFAALDNNIAGRFSAIILTAIRLLCCYILVHSLIWFHVSRTHL